jgi:hypothetical protein
LSLILYGKCSEAKRIDKEPPPNPSSFFLFITCRLSLLSLKVSNPLRYGALFELGQSSSVREDRSSYVGIYDKHHLVALGPLLAGLSFMTSGVLNILS